MRLYFITLITFLLFIDKSSGQILNQYEAGSYIIAGAPMVKLVGQLKISRDNQLLVKTPEGKKIRFYPEQVISFRVGDRKFIVIDRFKIRTESAPRGFAEVIDSGQVLLMRYRFTSDKTVMVSSEFGATGNHSGSFNLIRKANSDGPPTVLIDDWFYGPRKIFNRTLAPFVPSQRPDLLEMVKQNTVSPRTVAAFIRAINTGQPFK